MTIAVSGWKASNIEVLHSEKRDGQTYMLTKLQLNGADWAAVSDENQYGGFANNYFALPNTGLTRVEYVIPVCPFHHVTRAGRFIPWSYVPGQVSGGSPVNGLIRLSRLCAVSPSQGPSYRTENTAGQPVTTLLTTDTMRAYALFVGG